VSIVDDDPRILEQLNLLVDELATVAIAIGDLFLCQSQVYFFGSIAYDLGLTDEQVREAISDGGYNGITIRVRPKDRAAMDRYRH
jgi:hypothetical protein